MLVVTGSHTGPTVWGVGLGVSAQIMRGVLLFITPIEWLSEQMVASFCVDSWTITARLFLHLYFHSSSLPLNLNSPDSFCLYLLLRML